MDIPRMQKLNRFWACNPPLRDMVQAYLGIKRDAPAPRQSESKNTEQDLRDFAQLFSAAGGSVG